MPIEVYTLLLGSALTIVVGYISSRHNYNFGLRAEKSRIIRERLDKLSELVLGVDDWIVRMEEDVMAIPPRHTSTEPMDKIYLYATLYFPELWDDMHPLCDSARRICQAIRAEAQRRLVSPGISQEYLRERTEMLEPYLSTKNAAIDSIAAYIRKAKY